MFIIRVTQLYSHIIWIITKWNHESVLFQTMTIIAVFSKNCFSPSCSLICSDVVWICAGWSKIVLIIIKKNILSFYFFITNPMIIYCLCLYIRNLITQCLKQFLVQNNLWNLYLRVLNSKSQKQVLNVGIKEFWC